jgi:succinate-semialdehyde dehydrogenase/glutarate-semialdehyde dehydrogenase
VSFTGSTNTGRLIYEKAASTLKKVVLELGGSDPFIVMPDADLELTIKGAVAGRLLNAGQTCIASKRFIVFASHYDKFVEQFHARMSTFKTGNPSLEETKLAPLFASRAVSPLNKQLSEAIDCGARFILQPQWQSDCAITPGIIENVNKNNPLYQQEVFAPIAVMYKVNSMAEAISIANDTPFGLAASIWGTDLKMMEQMANDIECGSVFFNSVVKSDARMPFGGVKNSGIGRELGRWGISEFSNIKGHSFY